MSDTLTLTPNSPYPATGDSGLVTVLERITIVPDDPVDAAESPFVKIGPASPGTVHLQVSGDLAAVEAEWRAFEADAVFTPFQSFDWIAAWQRHVGSRGGTQPVIVTGRDDDGQLLFILPLAIERHGAFRRLCWLGSDLCDYNAPMLARDWPMHAGQFAAVWRQVVRTLRATPGCAFDLVDMSKLPQTIGEVRNPFLELDVLANASSAHIATLFGTWEQYYFERRSSATRKKERKQVKHLGESGAVKFVEVTDGDDLDRTLAVLTDQKTRSFARMGVENLFARPGYPEFYREVAGNRALTHLSRLDVGTTATATSLGLAFQGCYYLVLSSYDDGELSRFGPGRAHLRELLRCAIERGLTRFDFTIGDELYKRDWADVELPIYDYVEAATLKGWPLATAINVYRRTKRFIKKTPALWSAYSKARALAGRVSGRGAARTEAAD
jgi:CelD/BcsL family acetyltransferase involved in cellulose biosynthesis